VRKVGATDVDQVQVHLPLGFRSQDRLARWPGDPIFTMVCQPFGTCSQVQTGVEPVHRTGTITCPGGTAFEVRLKSLVVVDVDQFLC